MRARSRSGTCEPGHEAERLRTLDAGRDGYGQACLAWNSSGGIYEIGLSYNVNTWRTWTTNLTDSDPNRIIAQSVSTHEFGHGIGLAHPPASNGFTKTDAHAALTMYPWMGHSGREPYWWYTLARGDMLGAEAAR